jgi:hypothetical protein
LAHEHCICVLLCYIIWIGHHFSVLSKTNDGSEIKYLLASGGVVTLLIISLQETSHLQYAISNGFTLDIRCFYRVQFYENSCFIWCDRTEIRKPRCLPRVIMSQFVFLFDIHVICCQVSEQVTDFGCKFCRGPASFKVCFGRSKGDVS